MFRPMIPLTEGQYERLGQAITRHDEPAGWPIATLLQALTDGLEHSAQPLLVGWGTILDPSTCPVTWLPWLAQAVGATIPFGMAEEDARELIKNPPGWLAGTPAALINPVKATLTGTKAVVLEEHVQGDPWAVNITTFEAETPDPSATEQAARDALEAGFDLAYEMASGWTFNELADTGITFNELDRVECDRITKAIPGTTLDILRSWMA